VSVVVVRTFATTIPVANPHSKLTMPATIKIFPAVLTVGPY
jgi:hypothetical protein